MSPSKKPNNDTTPKNPKKVTEAIQLGQKLSKTPEITKVEVASKMYELISDESRFVIADAFMQGAGLTQKGAMTYFYNCRRNAAKQGA